MITAIVPAHNEGSRVGRAVAALWCQTRPPERVLVMSDGSTDRTVEAALLAGAEVLLTVDNAHRTAGALNQALATVRLCPQDLVLIVDPAAELPPLFLDSAVAALADRNVGAVAAPPALVRGGAVLIRWCALADVHAAYGHYYDEGPALGHGRLALELGTVGWRLAVPGAPAPAVPAALSGEAGRGRPAVVGSAVVGVAS